MTIDEFTKGTSGNTKTFFEMANNEYKLGNYEKAHLYFEKVLETDTKNYEAHYLKGLSSGKQFDIDDFKFKDLLQGCSDARKYIPKEKREAFVSSVITTFYNHGLDCEKALYKKFEFGVSDKQVEYYVERYFQIISFYDEIYHLYEFDLRAPKRILEITKSLKWGVKGKGNRYDSNCELIPDWKYPLSDETDEKLAHIAQVNKEIIQKYEPGFFPIERKTETPKPKPKEKGLIKKLDRFFS